MPLQFNNTPFVIILLFAIGLTGCNFIRLSHDLQEMDEEFRLIPGQIVTQNNGGSIGPIILVRYRQQGERYILQMFERLPETMDFVITLSKKPSFLIAIEDSNEDGQYSPGERYGFWGKPSPLTINTPVKKLSLSLNNKETLDPLFVSDVLHFSIAYLPSNQLNRLGTISRLNDLNLGTAGARVGVWQPNEFIRTKPLGIFQLQTYIPEKVPVLFVHGMGGYPEQFSLFIDNLDRNRFQPWVYSYPSGMRLGVVSYHLNLALQHLNREYQFSTVHIVAHSMGGLVSRGALLRCGTDCNYGGSLTSVATPWRGHKSANSGVKMAPQVVPSWFDMQPESDFLNQLSQQKLNTDFSFHMAFAYRSQGLSRENNDGAVTLESQLASEYQKEAQNIRGFNATHTTILKTQALYDWWESNLLGSGE